MARAILDGRKTQTRRVIKPQPEWRDGAWYWTHPRYDNGAGVRYFHSEYITPSLYKRMARCCPYGVPGDRLWVRETFAAPWGLAYRFPGGEPGIFYRADHPEKLPGDGRWTSARFMPRRACRILLELVDVRVERVQEISYEEARAEGLDEWDGDEPCDFRGSFRELWDSLNEKRGYGWDVNPWVWVIEFRQLAEERMAA